MNVVTRAPTRRAAASRSNAASDSGFASAPTLTASSTAAPRRIRFTGISSFLPDSVRGTASTAITSSGTWRGDSTARNSARDPRPQRVVERRAAVQHDEQHQLARPAVVVLEMDDEAVVDLGQPFDHRVELGACRGARRRG